ncbi:hypothetical protein [Flavobacterium hungaricum]|uniref:Uncharacterized protein n=1 Tax=Flavobacterium hungaricum TaxID=2082725 RepID=A0ABR9TNE5_9FLAO|nr:hypothetical protein [Flavobacterium hungaricum]MBE8726589.1 hypothetical protein [Flavobacterium hungaricum]
MSTQNRSNKKEALLKSAAQNHFKKQPPNTIAIKVHELYGMTLEQYLQGLKIHSKYFGQIKKIKPQNH